MAKKYVEVINNGTDDLYVADQEARAAIANVASTATCESIIDELN